MMYTLAQVDVLPTWLNVSFAQSYKQNKGEVENITSDLLKEYASSLSFIEQMKKIGESANSIDMQAWQKPEEFAKQMRLLKENVLNYMMSKEFIKQLESTSTLGKNVAIATMNKVVEVFDSSIKAMKSSQLYPSIGIQVSNFKSMLKEYFELLNAWSKIPSIQTELEALAPTWMFKKRLKGYIDNIGKMLLNINERSSEQLEPSRDFNVAGATLGSQAGWGDSIGSGVRLENVFSLIHQNLLVVMAVMANRTLGGIALPILVKELKNSLEQIDKMPLVRELKLGGISLIGIKLSDMALTLYFNWPQRIHSCTLQVIYSYITKKTELMVQFIGDGANDRWLLISRAIKNISNLIDVSISKAPVIVGAGKISWGWYVDSLEQIGPIKKMLAAISDSALNNGYYTPFGEFIKGFVGSTLKTKEAYQKRWEKLKSNQDRQGQLLITLLRFGKPCSNIASEIMQRLLDLKVKDNLMEYLDILNSVSVDKVVSEYNRVLSLISENVKVIKVDEDAKNVIKAIDRLIGESLRADYVIDYAVLLKAAIDKLAMNFEFQALSRKALKNLVHDLYFTVLSLKHSNEIIKQMHELLIDTTNWTKKIGTEELFSKLFKLSSHEVLIHLAGLLYLHYEALKESKKSKVFAKGLLYLVKHLSKRENQNIKWLPLAQLLKSFNTKNPKLNLDKYIKQFYTAVKKKELFSSSSSSSSLSSLVNNK